MFLETTAPAPWWMSGIKLLPPFSLLPFVHHPVILFGNSSFFHSITSPFHHRVSHQLFLSFYSSTLTPLYPYAIAPFSSIPLSSSSTSSSHQSVFPSSFSFCSFFTSTSFMNPYFILLLISLRLQLLLLQPLPSPHPSCRSSYPSPSSSSPSSSFSTPCSSLPHTLSQYLYIFSNLPHCFGRHAEGICLTLYSPVLAGQGCWPRGRPSVIFFPSVNKEMLDNSHKEKFKYPVNAALSLLSAK